MRRTAVVLSLLVALVLTTANYTVSTQALPPELGSQVLHVAPATVADLRVWDAEVTAMERSGILRTVRELEDTLMAGRYHERLAQYHEGIPIFGAEVTRQSENGVPISMFGTLYRNISVPIAPRLSAGDARAVMLSQPDAQEIVGDPRLFIMPLDEGGFALAYRVVTTFPQDITIAFVDAADGHIVLQYSDMQSQSAVGTGRGVLGDSKKISTEQSGGAYRTADSLRPPAIQTYDMRGNVSRVNDVLTGRATLGAADLATASDNSNWTDGAVVDGHVYAGWTYDYYFKRFGRRGLDDNNLAIRSLVHPVSRDNFTIPYFSQNSQYFTNAFWTTSARLMVYGVGLPTTVTLNGQRWNYLSGAIDVVAHELTHGVTQFSSNLIYRGESGALNEAFSDIMAAGAEFYYAAARGRPGNYIVGDDVVTPGGLRSMANPQAFNDPDHYSRRYLGSGDGFGVHINSGIPNHVFYLAIEGGINRTSGMSVQGVGAANREQIEKVFYRAFVLMLPSSGNFYLTRLATIQSARDLYGANSAAERAITQAWDAVGVQQQAARITFVFSPDPVPAAPVGACPLTRPNFIFIAGAGEVAGVPFNVTSSEIRFYTAASVLSSAQSFNFAQLFNACGPGSNRIPASGLPCTSLCVSLGGAAGGFVEFALSGSDDLGNRSTFTSPRLRLGTIGTSDTIFQGTLMSVDRRN